MWKASRSFFILAAAVITCTLAILEILKNHLGVDTQALLMQLGSDLGYLLVLAQTAFGDLVQSIAEFFTPPSGDVAGLETLTNWLAIIASVIVVIDTLYRMFGGGRGERF